MIDRREILDTAAQTSLTPHVVEKDYVLGWMLAGIFGHEELVEKTILMRGSWHRNCAYSALETAPENSSRILGRCVPLTYASLAYRWRR